MMEKDKSLMTGKILDLTLEIIHLLTGEGCTVVRKTSCECVTPIIHPIVSGVGSSAQSPITTPLSHSLIHETINKHKILELTNKIIELLTGEIPLRCQDVTVYFSKEEWEYLEGHKDLYRDIMIENHQPLTSLDASDKRCLTPLYSQDCPEEIYKVSQDHQVGDLIDIKVEVLENEEQSCTWAAQQCKEEEETPADIGPELQISVGKNNKRTTRKNSENMKSRAAIPMTREQKLTILFSQLEARYGPTNSLEDCFPSNPLKSPGSAADEYEEVPSRVGNNEWCKCQQCIPMPTALESVCCQEISKALENMDGHMCITEHKCFNIFCENPMYVNISMRMIGDVKLPPPEKDKSRLLRKAAYRGFLAWIHGYLGLRSKKTVPSCVVKKVRQAFQYTGLHAPNDYAAEYMAID